MNVSFYIIRKKSSIIILPAGFDCGCELSQGFSAT
jgi:hypothetical protein